MPDDLGRFEARFNSLTYGRFFFPTRYIWGKQALEDLVNQIELPLEVFIDQGLRNHRFLVDFLGLIHNSLDSDLVRINYVQAPWYEDVLDHVNRFPVNPSSILSIGGGSTSDFAKASTALRTFGYLSQLGVGELAGKQLPTQQLPVFLAMPSTCGSGAESSRYVVTYSKETGKKVHGKSWALVADWVLIEPALLDGAPWDVIVSSAFDAFVHFFESFSMRNETNTFSEMLSVHGMSTVIKHLNNLCFLNRDSESSMQELIKCGSLGGIAVSNTRTGHIHEAAGIILERTRMSHGFSLWVCFQTMCSEIIDSLPSRFALLFTHLEHSGLDRSISSAPDLIEWWSEVFQTTSFFRTGTMHQLLEKLDQETLIEDVVQHVMADSTWVSKESTFNVTESGIRKAMRDGLNTLIGNEK